MVELSIARQDPYIADLINQTQPVEIDAYLNQTYYSKVKQLGHVLNKQANVHFFEYYILYPDGRFVLISNVHLEEMQFFYDTGLYPYLWAHCHSSADFKSGWVKWDVSRDIFSGYQHMITQEYFKLFGVVHGYSWINQLGYCCEFISLANYDDRSIYQKSSFELRSIIQYLKQTLGKDGQSLQQQTIRPQFEYWPRSNFSGPLIHQTDFATTLDINLLPKKYYLSSHPDVYFTPKEIECLVWFMRGKTLEAIAQIMCLSPKTIERHFENLKYKLQLEHKYQLIRVAIQEGIY